MVGSTGNSMLLYGVIIRDRIKTANLETLNAYRTVAHDLLKNEGHGDDGHLRSALADLEKAISAKS